MKCRWHLNIFQYIAVRVSPESNDMFASKLVLCCFDVSLWCWSAPFARYVDAQMGRIYMCCWALPSSIITLERCTARCLRCVLSFALWNIQREPCECGNPPHTHTHKCRALLSAHANPRPLLLDSLMQIKTGDLNTEFLIAPTFLTPLGLVSTL